MKRSFSAGIDDPNGLEGQTTLPESWTRSGRYYRRRVCAAPRTPETDFPAISLLRVTLTLAGHSTGNHTPAFVGRASGHRTAPYFQIHAGLFEEGGCRMFVLLGGWERREKPFASSIPAILLILR